MRREEGRRGLMSFKNEYARTKVRVACYMAVSADKWIKDARVNECSKEHTSTKKLLKKLWQRLQ